MFFPYHLFKISRLFFVYLSHIRLLVARGTARTRWQSEDGAPFEAFVQIQSQISKHQPILFVVFAQEPRFVLKKKNSDIRSEK